MTTGAHLGSAVTTFVDGELPVDQAERARRHLVHCRGCSEAVAEERRLRRMVAYADVPVPSGGFEASLLAVGRSGEPGRRQPRVVTAGGHDLAVGLATEPPAPVRRRLTPLVIGVGAVVSIGVVTSLSLAGPLPGGSIGRSPLVPPVAQVAARQPAGLDALLLADVAAGKRPAAPGPGLLASPDLLALAGAGPSIVGGAEPSTLAGTGLSPLAGAEPAPASPGTAVPHHSGAGESGGEAPTVGPATMQLLEASVEATAWFVAGTGGSHRR